MVRGLSRRRAAISRLVAPSAAMRAMLACWAVSSPKPAAVRGAVPPPVPAPRAVPGPPVRAGSGTGRGRDGLPGGAQLGAGPRRPRDGVVPLEDPQRGAQVLAGGAGAAAAAEPVPEQQFRPGQLEHRAGGLVEAERLGEVLGGVGVLVGEQRPAALREGRASRGPVRAAQPVGPAAVVLERLGGLLPPPGVRERLHQVGDGEQPGGRVGEARVAGQPQEGGRVGRAVGGEVEAGGRPRAERGGADEPAAAGGAGEPLQVAARGPLVAVEGGRERERGELLGGVRVQLGGAGEAQPVVAGRDGGRRVPEEGLAASGDHQRVRLQRRVPGPAGAATAAEARVRAAVSSPSVNAASAAHACAAGSVTSAPSRTARARCSPASV